MTKNSVEDGDTLSAVAERVSDNLDENNENFSGNTSIARSIYFGVQRDRLSSAKSTRLFKEEEINQLRHLWVDKPTPQDAIAYIQAVINKIK